MSKCLHGLVILFATAVMSLQTEAAETYTIAHVMTTAHGDLQIMEDQRITPALESAMRRGGCTDPQELYGVDDSRAKPFAAHPLLPAKLRYVTPNGETVSDRVLEKQAPIARILNRRLGRKSDPIFLVETDDAACFGSYSGEAVMLVQFQSGDIAPVMAEDRDGSHAAIGLFSSLKSGWRIVRAGPDNTEIEQIYCRPDETHYRGSGPMPFLLTYITYRSDGHNWTRAKRTAPGIWESDHDFPPRAAFP